MSANFLKLISNLRLNITIATKSMKFASTMQNSVFDWAIGHHKIIDWRDGYPVYTIFSPAGFSEVQAHLMSIKIRALFQNRKFPDLAEIAVTNKCNCNCAHCCLKYPLQKRKELNTEEMIDVIKQCQDLGVVTINFLGREPLLRTDILELIKSVDKKRSVTLMFTCGFNLEQYAQRLKKAGLDSVAVSIDSHIPEKHDSIKGVRGLFDRAVRGINAAKKAGLTVAISSCIDGKAVRDGTLVNIIELGKRLKVNEILVFDAKPVAGFAHRKDLFYEKEWITDLLNITKKYSEKFDYPGIYPYPHIRSYKSAGCSGGTTYFAINPYGDIHPCDFNHTSFGNVLKTPLYLIWDRLTANPDFCRSSWNGCRLKNPKINKKCF